MAELAVGAAGMAGVGQYLPLLLFTAGGLVLASRANAKAPPTKEPSKEEYTQHQHTEQMHATGATMAMWQSMNNKAIMMGSQISDSDGLDLRGGGYVKDPNVNPLDLVFQEHVELATFDRADTFLTLATGANGEVRMRRRNAIVTTLTPEIHDPRRPEVSSTFTVSKHIPAYSNPAQIKQALSHLDEQTRPNQSLRKHYGVEFFNRAPGQSFRYEE